MASRTWLPASTVATVLLLLLLAATGGLTKCPSNGNTHAIYVTSNMGDNIWSFDTLGNYLGPVLNRASFPPGLRVDKLRSMRFGPAGHLYVSSARGSYSRVFAVSGNGLMNRTMEENCTRDYLFTVVEQDASNPFLDHPYDMVFHPQTEDLYVSNQNSMTVTRYRRNPGADTLNTSSPHGKRFPAWKSSANVKAAAQVDTEAASGYDAVEAPKTIPDNAGLFASSWSAAYTMSSVRGLAISPPLPRSLIEGAAPPGIFAVTNESMRYYLLVCDVAGNVVHVFDPETGDRLFGIKVPSPIQVMFPSRYYSGYSTALSVMPGGMMMQRFEVPFVYVTSKDDGMAYMVRFTSQGTSNANGMQGNLFGDDFIRAHRLFTINRPSPLHAASGIYENPSRDVLLIADRNGRRISSYASPFLVDYMSGYGPSPFLGYFVKQLPDQPEFIMSALLEHQENIPFCYELNGDGKFRYVALCTAASIWSVVLAILLITVPSLCIYRQIMHCMNTHRRDSDRHSSTDYEIDGLYDRDNTSAPLLSRQAPSYGSAK